MERNEEDFQPYRVLADGKLGSEHLEQLPDLTSVAHADEVLYHFFNLQRRRFPFLVQPVIERAHAGRAQRCVVLAQIKSCIRFQK